MKEDDYMWDWINFPQLLSNWFALDIGVLGEILSNLYQFDHCFGCLYY